LSHSQQPLYNVFPVVGHVAGSIMDEHPHAPFPRFPAHTGSSTRLFFTSHIGRGCHSQQSLYSKDQWQEFGSLKVAQSAFPHLLRTSSRLLQKFWPLFSSVTDFSRGAALSSCGVTLPSEPMK